MNVQPIQKAILAGLTGVGSFVFAYNLSKTWNVQGLVGGTKRDADTDLKRYEKGNLGYVSPCMGKIWNTS